MEYVIVTNEWMSAHGLLPLPTMRKTKDGSKIILHKDFFNTMEEMVGEDVPTYAHNSAELDELLQSEEWSGNPDGATNTADYIQVAAVRNLLKTTKVGIQTMDLTDNEALKVKGMYPEWSEFINKKLTQGMKVQYGNKLYKVRQDIAAVLENQPPSIHTAALYEEINETHEGTLEDPIPYNNNMELEEGKYYSQDGVTYLCTRSTGQAVYNNLSELVGIYVQTVERESFEL